MGHEGVAATVLEPAASADDVKLAVAVDVGARQAFVLLAFVPAADDRANPGFGGPGVRRDAEEQKGA